MSAYTILLYIHIGAVALYLILLLWRLYHLWTGDEESLLLFSEKTRALNLVFLGITVLSGIYLGFHYDFSEGLWFVVKLGLLIGAAFLGDYAFKTYNKLAGVGVLLLFLYICAISFTKSLDLVYAY
ncbi:MAG: SirB2 family protein [Bacteroidia bacterium]